MHATLATTLLQGKSVEALVTARQEPDPCQRHLAVAMASRAPGDAAASDAELQALVREFAGSGPYEIAELHAWRGEVDAAQRARA